MATGRDTRAGQVKDDDPDKKGHPGPPSLGLGVGVTNPPRERTYVEKTSKMPRIGLINRKRLGYKEKELIFGTWNVRRKGSQKRF
jgi:hypothetical protein